MTDRHADTATAPTAAPTDVAVYITPNDGRNPAGKLADAELRFFGGLLNGLKLIGFAVWERRSGTGRNVTFPARAYSVNGERRSFALLRPTTDTADQERVRDAILQAYKAYEQTGETAWPLTQAGHLQALPTADGGSIEPDGFRWAPDTAPKAQPQADTRNSYGTARGCETHNRQDCPTCAADLRQTIAREDSARAQAQALTPAQAQEAQAPARYDNRFDF